MMNNLKPINTHKQPLEDPIMEMKEAFIISPSAHAVEPTFRNAYFLKPIAAPLTHQLTFNPSSSSPAFIPMKWLKINFNGWRYWRYPQTQWHKWVDELKPKYESLWKKTGIFDAIMSTKSCIKKDQNLLCGVVNKWCPQTNTFVFPFGEATITLEDVVVLGGYSLFGHPIFKPLEDQEMKEVEQKLISIEKEARLIDSIAPTTSMWMDVFIGKGNEIEHEAFLATWMSIFVFPHKNMLVKSSLFPIAIHLARGNTIALAPAVLASLYNDLSWFKKQIVDLKKCHVDVNLQSPFYLVQVWLWERFKNLQPRPMLINNEDHILLKWHLVNALKIDNVRLALDSAVDNFIWRPYVRYADKCGVFYPKDEICVPSMKDLADKQMLSFVICLRVSELVGFDSIEQYLPHRVSMQFGFDQDVPGYVSRFRETNVIAWENYCRPFSDTSLYYFPSRFFKAGVTTCYAKWWKKSVLGPQGFVKNDVPQNRIASSSKYRPHAEIPKLVGRGTVSSGKSSDDGLKTSKGYNIVGEDVPSDFIPKLVGCTITIGKSSDDGSKANKGDNIIDVPSDYLRKLVGSTVTVGKSSDDGSKSSKGGNIVDNVVPSVQDGMKAGGNIDADGGNIVDDDVGFVQDGMKVGGIIDPDGRNIVDNADGGNIVDDADRGNVIHDDDTSGSIPKLLKTMSSENFIEDGLIAVKDVDSDAHSILPPKHNTLTPLISVEDCKHVSENVQFEADSNGSKEARLSSDTVVKSETQMESYGYLSEVSIAELEQRIKQLERVQRKRKRARLLQ